MALKKLDYKKMDSISMYIDTKRTGRKKWL